MAKAMKPIKRKIITKKTNDPCPPAMSRKREESEMIGECVSVDNNCVSNCGKRVSGLIQMQGLKTYP